MASFLADKFGLNMGANDWKNIFTETLRVPAQITSLFDMSC